MLIFSPFSLENNKIEDRGAENLANALVSQDSLEVLKWVQHVVFSYPVRLGTKDDIIQHFCADLKYPVN